MLLWLCLVTSVTKGAACLNPLSEETRNRVHDDLLPEVDAAWNDEDGDRFEVAMTELATLSLCRANHQPREDIPRDDRRIRHRHDLLERWKASFRLELEEAPENREPANYEDGCRAEESREDGDGEHGDHEDDDHEDGVRDDPAAANDQAGSWTTRSSSAHRQQDDDAQSETSELYAGPDDDQGNDEEERLRENAERLSSNNRFSNAQPQEGADLEDPERRRRANRLLSPSDVSDRSRKSRMPSGSHGRLSGDRINASSNGVASQLLNQSRQNSFRTDRSRGRPQWLHPKSPSNLRPRSPPAESQCPDNDREGVNLDDSDEDNDSYQVVVDCNRYLRDTLRRDRMLTQLMMESYVEREYANVGLARIHNTYVRHVNNFSDYQPVSSRRYGGDRLRRSDLDEILHTEERDRPARRGLPPSARSTRHSNQENQKTHTHARRTESRAPLSPHPEYENPQQTPRGQSLRPSSRQDSLARAFEHGYHRGGERPSRHRSAASDPTNRRDTNRTGDGRTWREI